MKATEIVEAIVNGNFTAAEINSFYQAYKSASKLQRSRQTAMAMATLTKGMKGKLINIRPKHLIGTEVEIVAIKQTRITVKDVNSKSDFSYPYTIPAVCFELDKV